MRRRFLLNPTFDMETGKLISHDGELWAEPEMLFDRSIQTSAKGQAASATGTAGGYGTQAGGIASSIIPTLERQAAGQGTGFTPVDLNAMRVAAQQGAGGAASGLTGQANLMAARTRNVGGFGAALDQAARQRMQQLSQSNLDIQAMNAQQKLAQQRAAQQQLAGLYGTDVSAQLKAMGLSDEDLKTALQAGQTGWLENTMGTLGALGQLGSGAGAVGLKAPWAH
jgi:hypothetical protein